MNVPKLNVAQEQYADTGKMFQLSEWMRGTLINIERYELSNGDTPQIAREKVKAKRAEYDGKLAEYMTLYNEAVNKHAEQLQKQTEREEHIAAQKKEFTEEASAIAENEADRIISQASEKLKNSMYYNAWVTHVRSSAYKAIVLHV